MNWADQERKAALERMLRERGIRAACVSLGRTRHYVTADMPYYRDTLSSRLDDLPRPVHRYHWLKWSHRLHRVMKLLRVPVWKRSKIAGSIMRAFTRDPAL